MNVVLYLFLLPIAILSHQISEKFEYLKDYETEAECGVLQYHYFHGTCKGANCFLTVDEIDPDHAVCSLPNAPLHAECEWVQESNMDGVCDSGTKRCQITNTYKHPFCGLP
ncbi:hypothetical protein DdX_22396 [Ditylenchus destructor]|uniref:Secreted protein n=1 Tax=Ditylenchus destructor TaxID=166010 RepID=A0AAD4MEW8_9BILA|nr:hypothetical protein DdX_22396 [Ditylenchus destructor]